MSLLTQERSWPRFETESIGYEFSESRFSCLGWKWLKPIAEWWPAQCAHAWFCCLRAACINSGVLCRGTPFCSDSAITCYFRTPSRPTSGEMGFSKAASYELLSAVSWESHSGTLVPWLLMLPVSGKPLQCFAPRLLLRASSPIDVSPSPAGLCERHTTKHALLGPKPCDLRATQVPRLPCQELLTPSRAC